MSETRSNTVYIDVRTPVEFSEKHIPGSVNIPLDTIRSKQLHLSEQFKGKDVIFVCRSGKRASDACSLVQDSFDTKIHVLEGGVEKWEADGKELIRNSNVISLERQVRITAGGITAIGSLLALLIHPGFVAIPLFIGSGLVFAGVTNTCGMAMILARMPWNKAVQCSR